MPWPWPTLYGPIERAPRRTVGRPKRDRTRIKASRKAARRNR
jgi:hypothetical protein